MIKTIYMVAIVITLHEAQALHSTGTGSFSLLMPNVKPYRVNKKRSILFFKFGRVLNMPHEISKNSQTLVIFNMKKIDFLFHLSARTLFMYTLSS